MLTISSSSLLPITSYSKCKIYSVPKPNFFIIRSSSSTINKSVLAGIELEPSAAAEKAEFPAIKSAKRVVLVRHGQSTWNDEGRIQGSSNFSVLTPKGESQAETSRQMLLDDSFDVCFTRFSDSLF